MVQRLDHVSPLYNFIAGKCCLYLVFNGQQCVGNVLVRGPGVSGQ